MGSGHHLRDLLVRDCGIFPAMHSASSLESPEFSFFSFSNFAKPFLPLGLLSNGEGHSTTEITKNTVGMYGTVNLHIITEEGSPCSVSGVWMSFSKTVDPSHLVNLTSDLLYSFLSNVTQSSRLSECRYFLLA